MSLDRLWLSPILAIGQLTLFILITNITHAFGHSERPLNRVKLALLIGFSTITMALGWLVWTKPISDWPFLLEIYADFCIFTAVVALPVSSAYLQFRRLPPGIQAVATQETDLAATSGTDALIGKGRFAQLLNLPGNEALRFREVDWEVTLADLPEALDGCSITHLSDLHLSTAYQRLYFEKVLDAAAAWESDLVFFTGDLVDDEEAIDWIVPLLARVQGRLGSFAILGNHDLDHEPERLRAQIREAHFTDLEAAWSVIRLGETSVAIGGTSYPWGPPLSIKERPEADFRILLSHTPDRFYWAERAGFELIFAGHNHGGQIRLPGLGAIFTPSIYSRRFARGFFRSNRLTMHVSQGIGGKHPLRYGCLPEVSRIVLRAQRSTPSNSKHVSSTLGLGQSQETRSRELKR